MSTRPPAVAGMFYPAEPATLAATVQRYINASSLDVHDEHERAPIKAIIVPHAGYQYSGAIAATAYQLLSGSAHDISRVVLLGPAHRVYVEGMAIPNTAAFDFPGGSIDLDMPTLAAIEHLPGICVSNEAHAQEHCLEVQLPFLKAVLGEFKLVPFVVGRSPNSQVAEVLDQLWGGAETLIVVSSDLSHFLPYAEACDIDRNTSRSIVSRSINLDGHEACGAHAINGLMVVARQKGLTVEVLDVRNSGDTAGDRSRVVGYGAFALR